MDTRTRTSFRARFGIGIIASVMLATLAGCVLEHGPLYSRQCTSDLECNEGFLCGDEGLCNRGTFGAGFDDGAADNSQPPMQDEFANEAMCESACASFSACGFLDFYYMTIDDCRRTCIQQPFFADEASCVATTADCASIPNCGTFTLASEQRCRESCMSVDACFDFLDDEEDLDACTLTCLSDNTPMFITYPGALCIEESPCAVMSAQCGLQISSEESCAAACARLTECGAIGITELECTVECNAVNLELGTTQCLEDATECATITSCFDDTFKCLDMCNADADCGVGERCFNDLVAMGVTPHCIGPTGPAPDAPTCSPFAQCGDLEKVCIRFRG